MRMICRTFWVSWRKIAGNGSLKQKKKKSKATSLQPTVTPPPPPRARRFLPKRMWKVPSKEEDAIETNRKPPRDAIETNRKLPTRTRDLSIGFQTPTLVRWARNVCFSSRNNQSKTSIQAKLELIEFIFTCGKQKHCSHNSVSCFVHKIYISNDTLAYQFSTCHMCNNCAVCRHVKLPVQNFDSTSKVRCQVQCKFTHSAIYTK